MKNFLAISFSLFALSAFSQSGWITIRDSITYDLSGATRKGSPGAYKYFSSNNSDDGRITRNVADFNRDSLGGKGWKVLINLQREYTLATDSAVKFYDPSGSRDTIDLYLFDKDNAPKWDTIINTQNYSPTYRIISCGTCAGSAVTTVLTSPAGRKVQFILAVIKRTNLFSGLWPNIRSIQFKGTPTGNADTTYNLAHWAFNQWTAKPIDSIIGNFNLPNQQDTLWHDTATANGNYGYFRSFDQMFFDNEAVKTGYRFDLGGAGYSAYKYNAALARRGNYQFAAVFNDNAYYKFQLDSIHHAPDKGWGVNTIYDDPQLPASYSRKGQYMGFLAATGGDNPNAPTHYPTYNGTFVRGQGYLKGMGTSNEATLFAFGNAWKTPIECAAEVIGVIDSILYAAPNMKVFAVGFEAYNYDDAKAVIKLLQLYYRSRDIRIHGISFHAIHTLKTDEFEVIPTSAQQVGNHGVSVGYNDDWRKDIHFVQGLRREAGNPNLLVQLDEDTHQKGVYKRKPLTEGETFSVSQLGTPRITLSGVTQNAYISHGIIATQDEFIATATPLYKHYWYQIVDGVFSSVNPDYDAIDQNNGKFDKPADYTDHPESWPADYYTVSRKKRLGRYYFVDSTLTNYRGLHIFKYRHVSADSTMYEFAILDSTGTMSHTLQGLPNGTAYLITPSGTSRQATQTTVTISGNSYTLNADPLPRALIFYEPASSGNQPPLAAAGADQTITLPTNSVTVNGSSSSDPDGSISTYLWAKVSGPTGGSITNPNNATTTITGLVAGTYVYRLTVTDNNGATATDDITITVNALPTPGRIIIINRKFKRY